MGSLRRDGRLRPGTLWVVFVVALLLGAIAGWSYRAWTHKTIEDHAADAQKELQHQVDKLTK